MSINCDSWSSAVEYQKVESVSFQSALRAAVLEQEYSAFVSVLPVAVYDKADCFLSYDSKSGYAVTDDGILISVFSTVSGRGPGIVESAIANGATMMECFEGVPSVMYAKHGFKEAMRDSFNEEFAPASWNYSRDGRPDYLTMIRV
jgi:hypothetical protein